MKWYLMSPPILSRPELGEDLYMYLAIFNHAVGTVLLIIRDGVQWPVYYISKTLMDSETWYLPLEKLSLALVHTMRKLPHYFQAHMVYVLTEHPLESLLRRFDFHRNDSKIGNKAWVI